MSRAEHREPWLRIYAHLSFGEAVGQVCARGPKKQDAQAQDLRDSGLSLNSRSAYLRH